MLQEHLRTAYEQSQTSVLEVLLSTDSFTKASSELSYMLTLSEEDQRLAKEIRDRRAMLETRRQTLIDGRATLPQLRANAAARAAVLAEQQAADAAKAALEEKQAQLLQLQDAHEEAFVANSQDADAQAALIARQEQELAAQQALVAKLEEVARARHRLPRALRLAGARLLHRDAGVRRDAVQPPPHGARHGVHQRLRRTDLRCRRWHRGRGRAAEREVRRLRDWRGGRPFAAARHEYWHLVREVVTVGQTVHLGDVIGYEGATGFATGCHLHFGVLFDGKAVNPRKYLP